MAFQSIQTGILDVFNPLLGSGLNIPIGFWEPGSLAAHKAHFGQGAVSIPFSAALVVGPSLTSPLSFNSIGLDVHTGVWNTLGTDIRLGTDVSIGPLTVDYSAVFSELNGLKSSVTPDWGATAPIIKSNGASIFQNSPFGNLNGFWMYNGSFISTGPHISDIRLKKNIEPLTNGLDKILKLNPVTFDWIENEREDIGLIAEQVNEIYPEFVGRNPAGEIQGIKYSKLTTILIKSIQELKEEVEILKTKING